jgi:DNA invertase Pin-like site-specific DNA recombinase
VRVSTNEQADVGHGLAVQRQQGAGMVLMKQWPAPQIYEDAGISGALGPKQRPALARLLRDVKAGTITTVIVASLDRLGRSTRIILALVDEIEMSGAALVSCRESLDTTTSTGRFVLTLLAAIARLDHDQIVKRMTDGRNSRGRRDGDKGGNMPLGYTRTDRLLTVDAAQAAVVRRVFRLAQVGGDSDTVAVTRQAHRPAHRATTQSRLPIGSVARPCGLRIRGHGAATQPEPRDEGDGKAVDDSQHQGGCNSNVVSRHQSCGSTPRRSPCLSDARRPSSRRLSATSARCKRLGNRLLQRQRTTRCPRRRKGFFAELGAGGGDVAIMFAPLGLTEELLGLI